MDNINLKSQTSSRIINDEETLAKTVNGWMRFSDAGIAHYVSWRNNKRKHLDEKTRAKENQELLEKIQISNHILINAEELILEEIKKTSIDGKDTLSRLRKIEQDLSFNTLFENMYKSGNSAGHDLYVAISKKLEFLESANVKADLIQQYRKLLLNEKILVESTLGGESENIADHQRFACYQLSRAKSFYGFIREIIESNTRFLSENKEYIFEVVQKTAWTEQAEIRRKLYSYKGNAPLLKSEKNISETYKKYLSELENIKTQIQDHSFNAPSPLDKSPEGQSRLEEHYKKHVELISKRDITLDIVSNQKKELSSAQRIKESIKDYASENLFNSKSAAKEFGKALAINAGKRLGKAILNELNKKGSDNNWNDISKDLALDFVEAGIMGAATFLLGPLGGSAGNSLVSFIRPKTDPYMEQFNAIGNKIDEGFQKTYEKLDSIDSKIKELQSSIEAGIKLIISTLDTKIQHNLDVDKVKTDIENARRLIFSIDSFFIISETHESFDLNELLDLDTRVNLAIQEIIGAFYNNEYSIYNSVHKASQDKYLPLSSTSLASKIIRYSARTNDGRFIPFDETISQILRITETIRLLLSSYIEKKELLINTIAASSVFRSHPKSSEEFLSKVIDLVSWRESYIAEYFAVGYQLDKLIIGKSLLTTYSNFRRYKHNSQRFNLLSGFAMTSTEKVDNKNSKFGYRLLEAKEKYLKRSDHLSWHTRDEKKNDGSYTTEPFLCTGFRECNDESYVYRYYLTPSLSEANTYCIASIQNGDLPLLLDVQITFESPDILKLYFGNNFSDVQYVRVHDLHTRLFDNSIEGFLLGKTPVEFDFGTKTRQIQSFSTPEKYISCQFAIAKRVSKITWQEESIFSLVFNNASIEESEYSTFKIPIDFNNSLVQGNKITLSADPLSEGETTDLRIVIDSGPVESKRRIAQQDFGDPVPNSHLSFKTEYFSDLQSKEGQRVNCVTLRPLRNILRSGFKSDKFNNELLCASSNNMYFLHADRMRHTDPNVILRGFKFNPSSVFKDYKPKNINDYTLYLQEHDGNLVIYEGRNTSYSGYEGIAIAASGFHNKQCYAESFIVLTNSGHLVQFSKLGHFLHELPLHRDPSYSYDYDEKTKIHLKNRLFPGEELSGGQAIISTNKQYIFQQMQLSWTGGIIIKRLPDDIDRNHSFKRCLMYSDEHQEFADSANSQKVVMQKDGNLVVYAKKDGNLVRSAKEKPVYASNTRGADGCFLMLSDDGSLALWLEGENEPLHIIKQYDE